MSPSTDQPGEPHPTDRADAGGTSGGADGPGEGAGRRRRWALIAAAVFAIASFGVWIWALFIYDPGLLIDELGDKTFPRAAEKVCAPAVAKVDALPRAEVTTDPIRRAAVIDEADVILEDMLARLRPIAPTSPAAAKEAVREWLGDWETHMRDRAAFAAELRRDPNARYKETTKGTRQISLAIDSFAQVNSMPSCATSGDVG